MIARLLLLASVALASYAQEVRAPSGSSHPLAASALRGQVVDADSGAPLAGAVLVARWNWLTYFPARFHGGDSYEDVGETLKISEAVSDPQGGFTLAGFGHPIAKRTGKLADNAPALMVFKSGYEPFSKNVVGDAGVVRLKRHEGSGAELAAKIAKMQGASRDGLHWDSGKETGEQMPRMLLAIHREKVRLGPDGAAILGVHQLAGRAGKGKVVDAQTGENVSGAVISMTWAMRRTDGAAATMRLVQAKRVGIPAEYSTFFVSPWRVPGPDTLEWEAVKDAAPLVRVDAIGYRHSAQLRWNPDGATLRLERLAATREATLEEMRALRRELDAEPEAAGYKARDPLFRMLAEQCRRATPDLRKEACYEPDSAVGRYLATTQPTYETENEAGVISMRVLSAGQGASRIEARKVSGPQGYTVGERSRVGGFTIEPAR